MGCRDREVVNIVLWVVEIEVVKTVLQAVEISGWKTLCYGLQR